MSRSFLGQTKLSTLNRQGRQHLHHGICPLRAEVVGTRGTLGRGGRLAVTLWLENNLVFIPSSRGVAKDLQKRNLRAEDGTCLGAVGLVSNHPPKHLTLGAGLHFQCLTYQPHLLVPRPC